MNATSTKSAIVTGAGSGVGRATALLLAEAGYDLLLVGRTADKLAHTAQLIAGQSSTVKVVPHAADIADPQACQHIIAAAERTFGRLDALINVAGYASMVPIEKITPAEWRTTMDINLSSVMYLTAAAWPIFKRQNAGFIANVSSMASVSPFPGFALYAPAKVALNMFTRMSADEGKRIGIKTVCIAPGAIETPMLRSMWDESKLPKNKTLDPAQVGSVIRDCLLGTRRYMSGETIQLPSP